MVLHVPLKLRETAPPFSWSCEPQKIQSPVLKSDRKISTSLSRNGTCTQTPGFIGAIALLAILLRLWLQKMQAILANLKSCNHYYLPSDVCNSTINLAVAPSTTINLTVAITIKPESCNRYYSTGAVRWAYYYHQLWEVRPLLLSTFLVAITAIINPDGCNHPYINILWSNWLLETS